MFVPRRAFLAGALSALVLPACERRSPARSTGPELGAVPVPPKAPLPSVLIENVPHVRQKPDFCGEAVVASWLGALGKQQDQDAVFDASGMDPARGMGVTTRELASALERLGFVTGKVWHSVRAESAANELGSLFSELHADLAKGVPSIVCTRYDERPDTTEHFRLVLGYDSATDEVVYHEPAEDSGAYRRMKRERFLSLWPLRYEAQRWTVIRLRLEPTRVEVPVPGRGFRPADYAQHVMKLRESLPREMSVVIEPPFVVVGNGGAAAVRRSAESTVRWTVRMLTQDYFSKPPSRILNVWLLRDAESYEARAKAITGEAPGTPYGFYSRQWGSLVMNIATGGGTLVHEIVHPYIEANFPACPAWFNEGLGSLYEQSDERDGHIVGLTNWRLAGLKRAIRAGRVPALEKLLRTTSDEFYGDDSGVHYAAARYLLYYLQERGQPRLLSGVHRQERHRPERLRHARRHPGQAGHEELPGEVASVRARADLLRLARTALPEPRNQVPHALLLGGELFEAEHLAQAPRAHHEVVRHPPEEGDVLRDVVELFPGDRHAHALRDGLRPLAHAGRLLLGHVEHGEAAPPAFGSEHGRVSHVANVRVGHAPSCAARARQSALATIESVDERAEAPAVVAVAIHRRQAQTERARQPVAERAFELGFDVLLVVVGRELVAHAAERVGHRER